MKIPVQFSVACLLLWQMSAAAAEDEVYTRFLAASVTNQWGAVHVVSTPLLVDKTNTAPRLTQSKLCEVKVQPQVEIAGIRVGMTMGQVVAIWGKPHAVDYHNGAPKFSYSDHLYPEQPYVCADVFFAPTSNSVAAVWLTFPRYRYDPKKPMLGPMVEDCISVLGEPSTRGILPDPFAGKQATPKHWYCRMVYDALQPRVITYFAGGALMGLELNGFQKGAESEAFAIPFCLE